MKLKVSFFCLLILILAVFFSCQGVMEQDQSDEPVEIIQQSEIDPIAPMNELQIFIMQLKKGFGDAYVVEVKDTMIDVFPPQYIVNIYPNPEYPRPNLLGLFSSVKFNVEYNHYEETVKVLPGILGVKYQGFKTNPVGDMVFYGLQGIYPTFAPVQDHEVIVMMKDTLLHICESPNKAVIEYDNILWLFTKDENGVIKVVRYNSNIYDVDVNYSVNDWGTGFTANITIKNNSDKDINGWNLEFKFPGNQKIMHYWCCNLIQNNQDIIINSLNWNEIIKAGQSVNVGFNASYSGINSNDIDFYFNGELVE